MNLNTRLARKGCAPALLPAIRPAILLALLFTAGSAGAADLAWSGFAEIGYARSDQSYLYDRFVDQHGTFRRDSMLGAQLDAQFSPRWSAIVQATLAPVGQDDRTTNAVLPWATLSWRPTNDIVLRMGKQRVPMFLNSENTGVGGAFNMTRLPAELYSVAPNADFIGASLDKSWDLGSGELSLDGYAGKGKVPFRQFGSAADNPGVVTRQATIERVSANSGGVVLTLRNNDDVYRAGVHYFRVNDNSANVGSMATDIASRIVSAGATVRLARDWRVTAEAARRYGGASNSGYNSSSAYLMLERQIGAWAPYVALARLTNTAPDRAWAPAPDQSGIMLPPPTVSDDGSMFGQSSAALGAAYAQSPDVKWKFAWMRVRSGSLSGIVNISPGPDVAPQRYLNVLSASYNVTF